MREDIHYLSDEAAMLAFGGQLANQCYPPYIIYLQGALGMGKTTLVRGFLWGLGYQGHVKSPTFTIVEPYVLDHITVYHFDLYRIADPEELEYIGLRDYLTEDAICLIEWPEKADEWLPKPDLVIKISQYQQGREVVLHWETE